MIVFLVSSVIMTLVVGRVESNAYSSYSAPQKPCSGSSFCGGHPNALPFEPRYPSVRVGVSPGYPGESEGNHYESNEAPENNYSDPSKEVGPPPPPPPCEENQLPVSVCVQLPPKTPLKLSKSILQQIIFSLTEGNKDTEPAVEPALPEPVTLPVYSPIQVPLYPPQPAHVPPSPPQAAVAAQPPTYSQQPSYPPPPQPPQVYAESPVYAEHPVYAEPPVYAESPVYAPQPVGPVNPVEPVAYEPEPTTPASIPANLTPRYPTYESSSSTGTSGQLPPYVQQTRPGETCLSCGSSLKPRYNQ